MAHILTKPKYDDEIMQCVGLAVQNKWVWRKTEITTYWPVSMYTIRIKKAIFLQFAAKHDVFPIWDWFKKKGIGESESGVRRQENEQ